MPYLIGNFLKRGEPAAAVVLVVELDQGMYHLAGEKLEHRIDYLVNEKIEGLVLC